ncbi:MAG: Uma2 family endonuclease [Terriglobia bacterium]
MPAIVDFRQGVKDQRVALRHVSWETYEHLLADHLDASSPRFTYDRGTLEIMSPSIEHEKLKEILAAIADVMAEEWQVEFQRLGSTTFRRSDLDRGLEPDSCFYIQNVEAIRGKQQIDLRVDPPPDLVIEIEITSPLLDKIQIYAQLGVPEIWRYDGRDVSILRPAHGRYESSSQSGVLSSLSQSILSGFVEQSKTLTTLAWRRTVRSWAREQLR